MKGYWLILGTDISDQEAQNEYGRLWKPLAEKYNARVNPQKVALVLKEARDAHRIVVVEFPSLEVAEACYGDPDYEEARRFALKAADRELILFEGELA